MSKGLNFFWRLYSGIYSLAFPILWRPPASLAHGPFFLSLKLCFHQYISFSDPDSSSSSFHLWGPLWLHWVFQDNPEWSSYLKTLNLITTENSLLSCKVTHAQVSGNKTWAFLGRIVLSTPFGESEMRQELTTRFLYANQAKTRPRRGTGFMNLTYMPLTLEMHWEAIFAQHKSLETVFIITIKNSN